MLHWEISITQPTVVIGASVHPSPAGGENGGWRSLWTPGKADHQEEQEYVPVTSWRSNGWCLGCLGSFYPDGPTKRRNRKEKSFRQGALDGDSSVPSLHFASIFSFSPWLTVTSHDFPWLPSEQVGSEDEGWRSSVIWTKRGQRELKGRIHDGNRLRHPDALAELGPKNGHRNHRS